MSDEALTEDLHPGIRALTRQLLLYKAIFMSASVRELAEDEPPAVAKALLDIHHETRAEAAGIALVMREWDQHAATAEKVGHVADMARRRFLADLLLLKESVVDVGLLAAMHAPTDELRARLRKLADLDRKHADDLREVLGARSVAEHARSGDRATTETRTIGVGIGRPERSSFRRALHEAIEDVRQRGSEPLFLTLSAEAARHARDEGLIDPATGRALGLPVEIDMGWRGECFAIETQERIGYAELLTSGESLP